MIEKTMPSGGCDVAEYLHGEDDLPVCLELDTDSWEADFLDQLGEDEEVTNEEEEDELLDVQPPPPKIKNFKEAVQSLEDVQQFLEGLGNLEGALEIGSAVDTMTIFKMKSSRQTTLLSYFSH